MTDLRFPIGKFQMPATVNGATRKGWIQDITQAPTLLRTAVHGLMEQQVDTPYRPEGWTVRQVVHHLADSHMNAYVRFKLALTENEPAVKTYMEDKWAELPEARTAPIEISLSLLEALHRRWQMQLEAMSEKDFERTFKHPELGLVKLERSLGIYAWHGRHHVAHITSLRDRMGWR
jgi:hypothetical protein